MKYFVSWNYCPYRWTLTLEYISFSRHYQLPPREAALLAPLSPKCNREVQWNCSRPKIHLHTQLPRLCSFNLNGCRPWTGPIKTCQLKFLSTPNFRIRVSDSCDFVIEFHLIRLIIIEHVIVHALDHFGWNWWSSFQKKKKKKLIEIGLMGDSSATHKLKWTIAFLPVWGFFEIRSSSRHTHIYSFLFNFKADIWGQHRIAHLKS